MGKIFSNKTLLVVAFLVIAGIVAYASGVFESKPAPQPKTIGFIQVFGAIDNVYDGLKLGMTELGYVEGVNIVYDYQSWEQDPTKVDGIAQGFIDKDVDIIYAVADLSALKALKLTKEAGKPIPIVFSVAEEPLRLGIIESFKSSGNNTTGIVSNFADVAPKQLEFMKRINPKVKKLGLFTKGFMNPAGPGVPVYNALKASAPNFGITIVEYTTDVEPGPALAEAFDKVAAGIRTGDIDAIYHIPSHFLEDQPVRETELGERLKIINSMPVLEEMVGTGGLFSYGADLTETGKQSAIIVDKILKGTKPVDIPIEHPKINVLGLNMKNAKVIGITIPDDIIEIAGYIIKEE